MWIQEYEDDPSWRLTEWLLQEGLEQREEDYWKFRTEKCNEELLSGGWDPVEVLSCIYMVDLKKPKPTAEGLNDKQFLRSVVWYDDKKPKVVCQKRAREDDEEDDQSDDDNDEMNDADEMDVDEGVAVGADDEMVLDEEEEESTSLQVPGGEKIQNILGTTSRSTGNKELMEPRRKLVKNEIQTQIKDSSHHRHGGDWWYNNDWHIRILLGGGEYTSTSWFRNSVAIGPRWGI